MTKTVHRIYIASLVTVGVLAIVTVLYMGLSYYQTSLEERFYHANHDLYKPSGAIGHGLGILGTLMMALGVTSYMMRKRMKRLRRLGVLKHWLEFHIFLCSVGPFLVLFHTAFKFGGIVSISFWSMVAVVLSGVIGRFIYIQIPRTIEGRELSLNDVRKMKQGLGMVLQTSFQLNQESYNRLVAATEERTSSSKGAINGFLEHRRHRSQALREVRRTLKHQQVTRGERRRLIKLVKSELSLNGKIARLELMQQLFRYWHVAHLPFALIMFIIMVIHVGVTLAFGYRWIF